MIEALFGSKTRVKLLHLFLNNPGKAFYVREITRLIDEQINSVRRELANMIKVGIISSDSADNKLYYSLNEKYRYTAPLAAIFADSPVKQKRVDVAKEHTWVEILSDISGVKVAIIAGSLVRGSASQVDLLIAGSVSEKRLDKIIAMAEKQERRELNYTILLYEEFYYRWSIRDRFITDILDGKHSVLIDTEKVLK